MWNRLRRGPARRFGAALRFPFRVDDYGLTLLVGVVLLEFGYLLLPALVFMGYLVAVIRTVAHGGDRPPPFTPDVELLTDGTKAFLVGLGFVVNPVTVALALVGVYLGVSIEQLLELANEIPVEQIRRIPVAVLVGDQTILHAVGALVERVLALGVLGYVSVVMFGVVAYLYPAALVRFALDEDHSIDAARNFGVLASLLLSPRYFLTWIAVLGLFVANWAVIWVPLHVPLGAPGTIGNIGMRFVRSLLYLAAFAVIFHLQLSAAYLVARQYRVLRPPGAAERPVQGLAQLVKARVIDVVRGQFTATEPHGEARTGESSRPNGPRSVLPSLRRRLYRPIAYPSGKSVTAMLLVGTFAVTQGLDVVPLVLSSGLIARVLRSGEPERRDGQTAALPAESNLAEWRRLVADGVRILTLWLVAVVPLFALVVLWTSVGQANSDPTASMRLLTLLVPGVFVGAFSAVSLLFTGSYSLVVAVWRIVFQTPGLNQVDPSLLDVPVLLGLVLVSIVEGFFFPAAASAVASTRRLRAGFSLVTVRRALSRRYLRAWTTCVTVATAGFVPLVLWLLYSGPLGAGPGGTGPVSGLDPELDLFLLPLPLGFLPVTEVLTTAGAPAHLLYPVVAFVYFYAQAVAFSVIGRASA